MTKQFKGHHFGMVMKGTGKINTNKNIDLSDYKVLTFPNSKRKYPIRQLSLQDNFQTKIGGTIYEVSLKFADDGHLNVMKQFNDLILAEKLI